MAASLAWRLRLAPDMVPHASSWVPAVLRRLPTYQHWAHEHTHLSVLSALPKCLAAHLECLPPSLASSAGILNSFVSEQSRPSLHMITCAMILKCSRKCTSWTELRWGGHWRGSQRKAIYFYCSRSWPVDIAREDRQSSFHKMFLTSRWRSRSLWDQAIWHVRILATNSQIYTKSCCFLLSFFFLIENVG